MSYFPFFKNFELCSRPYFTKENQIYLSKLRIIQKNLVHFQGFPDNIADKNLLAEKEYFGQYGNILKIVVVSKYDEVSKKKSKSAYITFSSNEEAAYAILAVDSIEIDGQIVRAFFGTSKYCVHFLNNEECFNKEKCMFIHELANDNDVLGINSKFGYSEHIKLAKKIINYDSLFTQNYISNLKLNFHTILPKITVIYSKEEINIKDLLKDDKRTVSTLSMTSQSSKKSSSSNYNELNSLKIETSLNQLFKSKKYSRFYNNENIITINNNNDEVPEFFKKTINYILFRYSFFYQFNKFISFDELIKDHFNSLYNTNNNDKWFCYLYNNLSN
jgi:hypothetical protein